MIHFIIYHQVCIPIILYVYTLYYTKNIWYDNLITDIQVVFQLLAGRNASCIGVTFTWQQVLQRSDFVVVLVPRL